MGASPSAMESQIREPEKGKNHKTNAEGKAKSKEDIKTNQVFPPNCGTFVLFVNLMMKTLLIIMGIGISKINKIIEKKERHTWANRVMNELVRSASHYKYNSSGRDPQNFGPNKIGDPLTVTETLPEGTMITKSDDMDQGTDATSARQNSDGNGRPPSGSEKLNEKKAKAEQLGSKETPLLIAAKMGVAEMVKKILDEFPVAVQDLNNENKNVVLLAVENRQTKIYQLLLNRKILGGTRESVFRQSDNQGNSALHLAATAGDYRPWLIPGAALQMQWEIKWYKFVKESLPQNFFVRSNKNGETPKEIFRNTHEVLVKDGREWLTKTSESCSVVAALIATVAFTTSATVPGGVNQQNGKPVLENEIPFKIFAISSLIALCFSITALVFFLAILTSRYQERDFEMSLPRKLLLGLTSLFTSIASILISFCSGHFFILKEKLRSTAYPIYVVTCFPMTLFALAQLPLYLDLIRAIFKKVPQRSYKVISH